MRLSDEERHTLLIAHRANLAAATDFAEYREAHLAYVDLLLEQSVLSMKQTDGIADFAWRVVETKIVSDGEVK